MDRGEKRAMWIGLAGLALIVILINIVGCEPS
jgi:hypothetical protein